MARRPRLLDLFCGAGGCARGYQLAGFHVTGIDHRPQPRYAGDVFVQADALEYAAAHGREYDAIHASPPCQRYSQCARLPNVRPDHPDMVPATRAALEGSGRRVYVIENVEGAPLARGSVMLCGLMFGLGVFRHRWFESDALLLAPPHRPHRGKRIGVGGMCCVAGHGGSRIPADHRTVAAWRNAMGIAWMTQRELSQAIPPAYTEYLGRQLRRIVG